MVNPPSHPFFVRGGFFIVSALALICFPAYADESVSNPDDSANAETIEVTARRLNDTDNRPSALITVIESDDQGPGLTTTVGMLRQAPAVRIRENGGLGQLATVGLRGAAPNQTLILLDGIPLADTTGVGIDLSIVPTPFIERIEVLRGAASSQYGSGALGGVVNLVTRSATKPLLSAQITGGSFGTWIGNIGASFTSGAARFLVAASALTTRGDFPFIDDHQLEYNRADDRMVIRLNNDATSGGILFKGRFVLPGAGTLDLTQMLSFVERGAPGMFGLSNQSFAVLKARESSWLSNTDLRVRYSLASASLSAGAALRVNGFSLTDPQGELTGASLDEHQEYNDISAFAALAMPVGGTHLIQARLQVGHLELRDVNTKAPARTTIAGLLQADINLFEERLYLSPSFRLEWTSDFALQLLPALGLTWRLTDQWQIKSNIGRAFRVPSFTELYVDGEAVIGNPQLKPESAWNADLTVEWNPWRKLHLSAGGFYARYEDIIIFEPFTFQRYKPINIGQADIGGVELEVSGPLLPTLDVAFHYTFLLAINRSGQPNENNQDLPGRPRHTVGARLFSHLNSWLLEFETYYQSGNFITYANTKSLASRFLLNAGIGQELGHGISVMAEGKNLLNNQVKDTRGFPLPGISFFLTVEYKQGDTQ